MKKFALFKQALLFFYVFWITTCAASFAASTEIIDDTGKMLHFDAVPHKVVSLVPSTTEIIFAIGAGDALAGITHHSSSLRGAGNTTIVGGFSSPSVNRIMALEPDLVIASSFHADIIDRLGADMPILVMDTRQMADAFRHIQLMGTLFHREQAAGELVAKNKQQLELIARKVAKIPEEKRKRVMRLMGKKQVMTPGNDSFQNEMIRAAGGIPPDFGKSGKVIAVAQDQFIQFNPQFIYNCGGDRQVTEALFARDGWKSVDAVEQHKIHSFPCDLTCRASSHLGYFVSWLASLIYTEEFGNPDLEVLPRKMVRTRPVSISLDFVREAAIATSTIHDFENKSLIVDFTSPRTVVSTLEGQRDGVRTVGNHYSPAPCWALNHSSGLKELRDEIFPVIGRDGRSTSFLFTGADMDNLAMKKETFKEMEVYALVTAGVRGNAVRMSRDVGHYYEPGTINMIFLTNMRLTPRAMTRAIISATEGKTAALQDLEIRSSYLPLTSAATGTGTDNIIVVQGDGLTVDNAGGHCKMGELIARAAYAGVQEAIFKQNGIVQKRDIFQRLTDRHLNVEQLVSDARYIPGKKRKPSAHRLEQVLLDPAYSGFLEAAMALSDGGERKSINNFLLFQPWCLDVADRIADTKVDSLNTYFTCDDMPEPLAMALNAIFTGISNSSAFTQ